MSIMQDYENIRKDLGFKYDAIEDYLNVVSPPSQYKKYEEELKKLSSLDYENFDIKNKELKNKYGITLLSDILYNEKNWNKYIKWFGKQLEPFKIIKHSDSLFSIILNEKDIDKSIFKYKFTGNGYDFENLFRSYVENKLPKLSNELRYDSEAGMFSAFSDSEKPLEKIAYYFNNDLKNNKDFITSLILNMTDYEVQL
jgi:hypothetical protein